MPTLSLRRALLLAVPLVMLLGACKKTIAQADLPSEIAEIEAPSAAVEVYGTMTDHPCPNIYEPPCADGTGCSPVDGTVISNGPPYAAPEFSWTYGCNPDGYQLTLRCTDPLFCDLPVISQNITTWDASLHGPKRSYDPDMTLQPGFYTWRISAFQSDIFPDNYFYSTSNSFWVGETCTDADDLPTPSLSSPWDGQVIKTHHPSTKVEFSWFLDYGDPIACLPDDFNGQIATDPDFTQNVVNIVTEAGLLTHGESEDALKRCRTYYWRVRSMLDEVGGPWSETQSFRIRPAGDGWCLSDLVLQASVNLSCRIGPGSLYGRVAYIAAGESHPVDGRNADGTWLHLYDLGCYVNRELGDLLPGEELTPGVDPVDVLPVLPDPELPTETPKECKPTMGQTECEATGGTWIPANVRIKQDARCDCP